MKLLGPLQRGVRRQFQVFVIRSWQTSQTGSRCSHSSGGDQLTNKVRVRFAPSPTGQLHLGGLRTALYNFLFARSRNGRFILRIEDTDQTRLIPGAVEALTDMLKWVGIDIDEGPHHGGSFGPYIQSQRLPLYSERAQKLLENGTVYRCFCSTRRLDMLRKEAVARGEVPKYDNRCRHLSESQVQSKLASGEPYVLRFRLETYKEPWQDLVYGPITYDVASIEGDPIMIKSDGYPTYHFANVVDDHFMQITHVLRGIEWQASTTKHILLYKAFGWEPPAFAHLPLLTNKDGKKLSKRQNDVHVEQYKKLGYFPEAVLNLLTNAGSGFTVRETAGMVLSELINHFDVGLLNTHSTPVDFDRVDDFNQLHLQRHLAEPQQRLQLIDAVQHLALDHANTHGLQLDKCGDDRISRVLDHMKERICLLTDLLRPEFEFVWLLPDFASIRELNEACSSDMIERAINAVSAVDGHHFDRDILSASLEAVMQSGRWSYKRYMRVLRRALSGPMAGPQVVEILTILGKDAALSRLQQALAFISDNESVSHS